MGFDVSRFVGANPINEDLICNICKGVLEDAVWSPNCEHAFCKGMTDLMTNIFQLKRPIVSKPVFNNGYFGAVSARTIANLSIWRILSLFPDSCEIFWINWRSNVISRPMVANKCFIWSLFANTFLSAITIRTNVSSVTWVVVLS